MVKVSCKLTSCTFNQAGECNRMDVTLSEVVLNGNNTFLVCNEFKHWDSIERKG